MLNKTRPFSDISTIPKINCFWFTFEEKSTKKEKPSRDVRASPVNRL